MDIYANVDEGEDMANGSHDSECSQERLATEGSGEKVGPGVVISPLCPSPEGSPGLSKEGYGLTSTNGWNSYIEQQIIEDWEDLSNQKRAFCDEYLANGYNHCDAAEEVGRSRGNGKKILQEPLVREYLKWRREQYNTQRIVDEFFLDAHLSDLYDIAMGEVAIPIVTGSGESIVAQKFQGGLALQILQERAKLSGVAKPEDVGGSAVNVIIDVGALTGKTERVVGGE